MKLYWACNTQKQDTGTSSKVKLPAEASNKILSALLSVVTELSMSQPFNTFFMVF